jgi:hypothetical protein
MADKKCPKCNLWNAENAQICDCGYNFIENEIQQSILKRDEYKRIIEQNSLQIDDVKRINKNIILGFLIGLIFFYADNLPFFTPLQCISCIAGPVITVGVILLYIIPSNNYVLFIIRKLWVYPIIGIITGFFITAGIFMVITLVALLFQLGEFTINGNSLIPFTTLILIIGIIGLYIGKKKVIDDVEQYYK